jgi:putative ABC transport system permease protein
MNYVAIRMLVGDRLKYIGLVAGLTFASLLITQQASIFAGFMERTVAFMNDTCQADLWVMDAQNEFTDDRKPILDSALFRVRGSEGVEWAVPLYKGFIRTRLADGGVVTARMVGLDDTTLLGGPPTMVQGHLSDLRQDKGILVDDRERFTALNMKKGINNEGPRELRVGDRIDINDREAVVVGTFIRSREFFWDPLIFTTYSRALQYAPAERKALNYILVKVRPGYNHQEVARAIRESTKLGCYTHEEFKEVARNFILIRTGILANFGITIGLGFVIGALVSGQLLYTFVLDNLRYYAAMKAMGATNGVLARMILAQTSLVGAIGFGLGVGIASLTGNLFGGGSLAFHLTWEILLFGAAAVLLCCIIAGLVSLLRVFRLEPGIVFKA